MDKDVLKAVVLVLLVFQNCALILTMKYSVSQKPDRTEQYMPVVAVTVNEIMKFSTCLLVVMCDKNFHTILKESFFDLKDYILTAVPALLYFVQNNLLYFAVSRLDTAVFQVTYQLKILTTAIFSVLILSRKLTKKQWLALLLLVPGVALVQLSARRDSHGSNSDASDEQHTQTELHAQSSDHHANFFRQASGLAAILAACITSGFAGVFFEKVLKGKKGKCLVHK